MPEFVLNTPLTAPQVERALRHSRKVRLAPYNNLSLFAQGFVEACFFTNGDDSADGQSENSLNDLGAARLTKAACKRIGAYCDKFEADFAALLEFAYEIDANSTDQYDSTLAGHDLWYTSKGHGVGFWDRKALERETPSDLLADLALAQPVTARACKSTSIGDVLSACAREAGELYVMSYRGWIDAT